LTLINRAKLFREMGKMDSARADFQRSLAIAEDIGEKWIQGMSLRGLGWLYTLEGDAVKGETYLRQGLDLALAVGFPDDLVEAFKIMGDFFRKTDRDSLALAYYRDALERFEAIQRNLGTATHQQGYLESEQNLYRDYIETLAENGQTARAGQVLESMKAHSLWLQLNSGRGDFGNLLSEADTKRESELIMKVQALNSQAAGLGGTSLENRDSLKTKLAEARDELSLFREELYRKNPAVLKRRQNAAPFPPSRLQQGLDDSTAAVEYLVNREKLLLFVYTATELRVIIQEVKGADVEEETGWFLSAVKDNTFTNPETLSGRLYTWLIKPLEETLRGKSRLCVVADGILHYLPFDALVNPQTGRYLLEDYAVFSTPSLSTFCKLEAQPAPHDDRLLALGNPQLPAGDITEENSFRKGFAPLPASEQELDSLALYYRLDAHVFKGREANETNFRRYCSQAEIIHFATHAQYNEFSPAYSAVILTADADNDGFLEAWEISRLNLRARLTE